MRRALVLACVLAAAPSAWADRFVNGPYLQRATPTSVTLMWEADGSAPATITIHGAGAAARVIEVAATAHAEIVVDGLAPASRYRYEVALGERVAKGELTTAPPPGAPVPLTFVVYGDTRSSSDAHRRLVERIRAEVPDFLLGTGDLVDDGAQRSQWQTFFDVEGPLLADNVFYPALGNHDRQGRARSAEAYRARFALPDNGTDPERVYAFTYGPARFVVLDSNSSSFALTDQTAWLERELAAARQDRSIRQIFVVMHHPPYSISIHGGQRDLRERWTPLFEKYGVAAVFSGHDHCYQRAEAGGVHYFVSGGGGAPLYARGRRITALDAAAVKRYERVSHYLRVHVVGDRVEVTAVRVDGTPIETTAWGEAAVPEPLVAEVGAPVPEAPVPPVAALAATLPPRAGGGGGVPLVPVAAVGGLVVAAALVLTRKRRRPAGGRVGVGGGGAGWGGRGGGGEPAPGGLVVGCVSAAGAVRPPGAGAGAGRGGRAQAAPAPRPPGAGGAAPGVGRRAVGPWWPGGRRARGAGWVARRSAGGAGWARRRALRAGRAGPVGWPARPRRGGAPPRHRHRHRHRPPPPPSP
ncbi:MAG: metallophosphoesterase [Myxococcales bacterium]|nr:metallophosphoesterase [Myxococcales bacterium]